MPNALLPAAAATAARSLIVVAACLATSAAYADCESRKPRVSETTFNSRAVAALHAALPPLPAGVEWADGKAYDYKSSAPMEYLCEFSKEGEFSVTAKRSYYRKHSEAERRALQAQYDSLTAQFHSLKKTPPDKVAEQQALYQHSNAAWQATRDAEKAGDKAAAQARDAEYRALRNQAAAIDTQHQASVKAQTDELDKRRITIDLVGQKVEIALAMNHKRLPAARADNTSGAFGSASPGQSTGLKVHNLGYTVNGTEGPLRQALAAAIDRTYLQGLVGKPLPAEAQSEALAAKATPAVVAEIAGAAGSEPAATATTPAAAAPAPARTTTAAATPAPAPATAPPAAPSPPPGDSAAAEPLKKAADAVNKLRGLLGR